MQSSLSITLSQNPPKVPAAVILTDFLPHFSAAIQFFLGLPEATIVTLSTLTAANVKSPKKTALILGGEVLKLSRVQVITGTDMSYSSAVNGRIARILGRKPDFVAKPRQWGARVPHTPFVLHKGKLYLETIILRSLSHTYILNTAEGPVIVHPEKIKPFLAPQLDSARQADKGLEGPRQVLLRDYRLDRIRQIRAMGGKIVQQIPLSQAIQNALS